MIIKIKKRALAVATLSLILAVILVSVIIIPIAYAPTTNTTLINFKAELVISNRAPNINVSNATFAVDPVSASSVNVLISFNITDADGASDINASKAVVNFTLGVLGSGQYYSNSSSSTTSQFGTCGNYSPSATVVVVNCSVVLPYYANASSNWVVNISVPDKSGSVARNDTLRFTVNELSSISLPKAFMNFSSVNLGQQDASSNLAVNNTGNFDFNQINITAGTLTGVTTPSETIAVTNFYVNTTNATAGLGAQLATTPVTLRALTQVTGLDNATLQHGFGDAFAPNADKGNQTIYFWVDVPSSGLSSQVYNATWNITVK